MAGGIILVVEDDPTLRRLYTAALSKKGYTVIDRSDGESAIETVSTNLIPRLVILDVGLPGISGIEVCKRLRGILGQRTPILFLTAADDRETFRDCIQAGGDDFLIKGAALSRVLERIAYWMHAPTRGMSENQRRKTLQGIEEHEKQVASAQKKTAARRVAKTEPEVVRMAGFIVAAQKQASPTASWSVKDKLKILGYTCGVVNYHANINLKIKVRFTDYLRKVMLQTAILGADEVDDLISAWDELYADEAFRRALELGEQDCGHAEQQDGFLPGGLAELVS